MDIRNFMTFNTVVEAGGFTKAANHLNYAQSTVTLHIKELEKHYEKLLFDRIGKRIYLTQFGKLLYEKTKYKNLILKLGSRGVFCNGRVSKKYSPFSIGAFSKKVLDPVGSGDALLAYASLSLKVSKSLIVASIIGSFAAACACELEGNKPVTLKRIIEKIKEVEKDINLQN